MRRVDIVAALGALSLLAAGAGFETATAAPPASAPAAPASAAKHEVVIQALANQPATLKVKRGDVVTWVNRDPFPHTVTAAGAFDSGPIEAGKSWRYVARRAGVFPYVCTLHSNMKGTLEVE